MRTNQKFAKGSSLAVLVNLDALSSNADTVSIFVYPLDYCVAAIMWFPSLKSLLVSWCFIFVLLCFLVSQFLGVFVSEFIGFRV